MEKKTLAKLSLTILVMAAALPLPVAANESSSSNGSSNSFLTQATEAFEFASTLVGDARAFIGNLLSGGASLESIFPSLRTFVEGIDGVAEEVTDILAEITEAMPFLEGLDVSESALGIPDLSKIEAILSGRAQDTIDEVILSLGIQPGGLNPVTDLLESRVLATTSEAFARRFLDETGQEDSRTTLEDFTTSVESIVDSTGNTLGLVENAEGTTTTYGRIMQLIETQREAALQRQEDALNDLRNYGLEIQQRDLAASRTQLLAKQVEDEAKADTRDRRNAALRNYALQQSYAGFVLPSGTAPDNPDATNPFADPESHNPLATYVGSRIAIFND